MAVPCKLYAIHDDISLFFHVFFDIIHLTSPVKRSLSGNTFDL